MIALQLPYALIPSLTQEGCQQIQIIQGRIAACVEQFWRIKARSTPWELVFFRPHFWEGRRTGAGLGCSGFAAVAILSWNIVSLWSVLWSSGPEACETVPYRMGHPCRFVFLRVGCVRYQSQILVSVGVMLWNLELDAHNDFLSKLFSCFMLWN